MIISQATAWNMLEALRCRRQALLTASSMTEAEARELVKIDDLIKTAEGQLAHVPPGMYDKSGNVR